jgi:hypothetical protein
MISGAAGIVAGAVAAAGMLVSAGVGAAGGLATADRDPTALIEGTHLPPLLTIKGEAVTLRYDVYCTPLGADPDSGAPCDAAGTVFVRAGDSGPFRAVPLHVDATASEGRYAAAVPDDIVASPKGFSYYAVLRSVSTGAETVLPSGGSAAPQRSRPLDEPTLVSLGSHVFGSPRRPTARVATASWGSGDGQVGFEQGPELQPVGGSSFDVNASGVVSVLDEANRRVLEFSPGFDRPRQVPIGIRGTVADLAVGGDGSMTVLETVGDNGETPLVRSFDASGRLVVAAHLAERSAGSVELGPDGPVVLEYPAGQWMPVVDKATSLTAARQRSRGRAGRMLENGDELVVQREGDEARIAQIGPRGVRRSWRIQSSTPLGEIQLAKPLGDTVVVVLRVYTDARDEFEALVLDDNGVAKQFSIDSAAWAETAPLARLRLSGSALYELGSTSAGVFVDRYDLEVS